MKLSLSLLQDHEIGRKIFTNSVEKSKVLLADIFDLDFKSHDPRIKDVLLQEENHIFKVTFNLNEREIIAVFNFEKENDEIVQEVLRIHENLEENLPLKDLPGDFKKSIDSIMYMLEKKYEINFTPLDPDDRDENIKEQKILDKGQVWETIFTHDDHEAEFRAIFTYSQDKESSLIVKQHKQHIIYLE